jgi:hypothetical protein
MSSTVAGRTAERWSSRERREDGIETSSNDGVVVVVAVVNAKSLAKAERKNRETDATY